MTVDYSLADQIHASAKLKDVTSVKLWLGADVMLEYGLEEAKKVLVRSLVFQGFIGSIDHHPALQNTAGALATKQSMIL